VADEDLHQEDKTEAASERRLQRAFEDGDVPVGRDLVAAAALFAGCAALFMAARNLRDSSVALVREGLTAIGHDASLGGGNLTQLSMLGLGIAGAAALGAIAATVAQTRGGFWGEHALPDFSRLASGRFKRLFTWEGVADLGIAALKVGVIVAAVGGEWRVRFMALDKLAQASPESLLQLAADWFFPLMKRLGLAVLLLAGTDLAVSRWRFAKRLRMTKEEAKREMKEEEGDPLIRGRRRRKHRELLKNRVRSEVPKADAVVVNPTTFAVAIRYRKEDGAPRVTAKGKGALAEVIRDLARENGVPIVENVPLARLLYKRVKVGKEIPIETYKAVAAVLAFVYRITGRKGAGLGVSP
jgi:flagellar biosynthesis protein FlhB